MGDRAVQIIAGLLASTAGLAAWWNRRAAGRKLNTEADNNAAATAQAFSDIALGLVDPIQTQLDAARAEIAEMRQAMNAEIDQLRAKIRQLEDDGAARDRTVGDLRHGVAVLTGQLEQHGIEPAWRPPAG